MSGGRMGGGGMTDGRRTGGGGITGDGGFWKEKKKVLKER